ncbi:RNA polymerase sigma factor [Vulgatibacter incomptus]|nr:RNA polymerase sigma factor [Vulgatibacter incomptus]
MRESPTIAENLYGQNDRFLRFVERRVGSKALAEEILQDAYVKSLTSAGSVRDDESITAWFYRLLRNAIIDGQRRRGVESRSLERIAVEPGEAEPLPDAALMDAVCSCVGALVDTLKPEYAAAIRRVEVEGSAVGAFAEEAGITPNNARVRLHRAREALRRAVTEYCGSCAGGGCRDCSCQSPRPA